MKYIVLSIALLFSVSLLTTAKPTTYKTILTLNQDNAPKAELVAVRGTKINLAKPEGFVEATNFPGFQQNSTGATLVVTELPGPYKEVSASFTVENLKSRGMLLQTTEKVTIDGYNGLLIKFTQEAYGQNYDKLGVLFGDDQETIFIIASFLVEQEKDLLSPMKNSLLSAKWDRKKSVDPFADLDFGISEGDSLKFTKRVQSNLLYTKGGKFPVAVEEPILIIGKVVSDSPDNAQIDAKAVSEARIKESVENKNIMIQSGEALTIDNLNGYELVASGEDSATNTPVAIYQVMLFEGKNYYIIQGIVGTKTKDVALVEFKKLARSFKKKAAQ
jgi:hypothetical protein